MTLPRLALAALLTLFTAAGGRADDWVYFGTYTGGKGFAASKGIYRSKFETATGKLSTPEVAAEMGSPSFLAIHPNGKFLYAVGEGGGKEGGPVVAFALDAKTGSLTKLNEEKSGGSGPCHISVSSDGKFAAVANYGGGSTSVIGLERDGKLGKWIGFRQHAGSSVNPQRQKEPHAHCSFFTPDGGFVMTADLGTDTINVWSLAMEMLIGSQGITVPPGSGPRHFVIAPDAKVLYVCGELDSTVNVVTLDFARGFGANGKVVQSLSTLPAPHKGNSTAECIMHPNGKFVYVSNRGHNSIAVFKVGDDRKLTAAGHITGDIKTPRNFNIDPSGKWMLIASQDGDKVGVWEINPATGMGKETDNGVVVGRPVCVKFVPTAK